MACAVRHKLAVGQRMNAASSRGPANRLSTRLWLAGSGSECHEWPRLSLCSRKAVPPSKVGSRKVTACQAFRAEREKVGSSDTVSQEAMSPCSSALNFVAPPGILPGMSSDMLVQTNIHEYRLPLAPYTSRRLGYHLRHICQGGWGIHIEPTTSHVVDHKV